MIHDLTLSYFSYHNVLLILLLELKYLGNNNNYYFYYISSLKNKFLIKILIFLILI